MPLTLYVDGDRWRAHLRSVLAEEPGLVPVAKGNGYGLGIGRLARRAEWLGVDTVAVGQYDEVPEVADRFGGSMLVLSPWRPFSGVPLEGPLARRLIHTVSRTEDLGALVRLANLPGGGPRVVLELLTSMRRHGFAGAELGDAISTVPGPVQIEGVALHLPLDDGNHLPEVDQMMADIAAADLDSQVVWVSHLSAKDLARLRASWPGFTFRPRIGTRLWLGDRGALAVRATVLDTHPVERGDTYGYRGRAAPRRGTIVVVSGGTAHGIGLEAPTGDTSLRSRASTLARGGLDAAGLARSPYTVDGKLRFFAEPPHMQASMLFLPAGVAVPRIGDELDVRVRFTTTTPDRVEIS